MTGVILIDECGNLGKNGTRFFVLSAVITNRSRNLLPTSKLINNTKFEMKYSNSTEVERTSIIRELSKSDIVITYVVVDKRDYYSHYYGIYGNKLYLETLSELFRSVSGVVSYKDVNVLIDRTSAISKNELKTITNDFLDMNVIKCEKYNSSSNKCIQIADFVAGTIWHMYERNEYANFKLIEKRVRRP